MHMPRTFFVVTNWNGAEHYIDADAVVSVLVRKEEPDETDKVQSYVFVNSQYEPHHVQESARRVLELVDANRSDA